MRSDWLKDNVHNVNDSQWIPIQVDTVKGLKTPIAGNRDGGIDVDAFFLGPDEGNVYHLIFSTNKRGLENELEVFSQMLSDFTFIE